MSIRLIIDMTNNAILCKLLVIARNRSARFGVSSALGALGRRFESCRPDSYSNRSQQYQEVSLKNP